MASSLLDPHEFLFSKRFTLFRAAAAGMISF